MEQSFGDWRGRQVRGVVRAAPAGSPASVRVVDRVLASLLLIFFLPLMLAVALLVAVTDRGPVIFGHVRVGRNGRPFRCLKFRSMVVDAEAKLQALLASDPALQAAWDRDHKLPRDPRITAIGRFLRASSLDELPQLINVLKGEMSLVGPRPISSSEVPRYGRYIVDYYHTTPGLTGLWQISGRNDVSYRRRVALDVAFSRSQSLSLYLRILVMTVPAVLLARGSY